MANENHSPFLKRAYIPILKDCSDSIDPNSDGIGPVKTLPP